MVATLHILNKAPDHERASRCLSQLEAGDSLVLMENGSYGLTWVAGQAGGYAVYALDADIEARGLRQHLPQRIQLIDYPGLVALTVSHQRVINW